MNAVLESEPPAPSVSPVQPTIPAPALTPDRLLQIGMGFWAAKTMLSAVELGVFTVLAEAGTLDCRALAERLGVHPRGARDFFDVLVALGVLQRSDGRYANTPESDRFLDRRKSSYVGGLLEMANARLYGHWGRLSDGLRTGRPQNEMLEHGASAAGSDAFAAIYADPDRLRGFLQAMTGVSLQVGQSIAERFDWSRYARVLDVGTAQGGLPVTLLARHAHLSGIGFDLPPVRPIFEQHVASHGLSDRLRFVAGDLFKDALPRADVIVMGHMLHGWGLQLKRAMLAKAFEALPKGGSCIVYDAIIDDDRKTNAFGLLMSLNMLLETEHGFDYTAAECMSWMRCAGFREVHVAPLTAGESMVVGVK